MATRKKTTPAKKKQSKEFWNKALGAGVKAGASAAQGAALAVVEVKMGDKADTVARGVCAAVGVAGQLLLDPEEHDLLYKAAESSVNNVCAISANRKTAQALRESEARAREKERAEALAALRADLEPDQDRTPVNGKVTHKDVEPVPVEKKKKGRPAASKE